MTRKKPERGLFQQPAMALFRGIKRFHFNPTWMIWVFGLLGWALILKCQNPGLMADDSGEMASAAVCLGIPHPPGYPLLTMMGRLATLVPIGSPAFRLNLFSSLVALAAIAILAILLSNLSASPFKPSGTRKKGFPPAIVPLLIFATTLISCRNVFAQCLTAKGGAYTLALLTLAALLYLRLGSPQKKPLRALGLGTLIWSAGMGSHWPTLILWIPFLAYWLWELRGRLSWRWAAWLGTLLCLGFSVYLYLPLRSNLYPLLDWGHPASRENWIWTVTRRLARNSEPFLRSPDVYWDYFKEFLRVNGAAPWPGFFLLAIPGGMFLWRRDRRALIACLLLYLPVVLGVLAVPPREVTFLTNVYLVAPNGALAVLAFIGMGSVWSLLPSSWKIGRTVSLVLLALIALGWLARSAHLEDKSRYLLQEDFGWNVLKSLPRNAVILAEGDATVFPNFYHRIVRHQRQDLTLIPFVFLHYEWGWDQAVRQRPRWSRFHPATLEERLNVICADVFQRQETRLFPQGQELYYTLDTFYLEKLVPPMMNLLRPMGLVRGLTNREPDPLILSALIAENEARQRRRGGPPGYWADPEDVASWEILRRYGDQHGQTGDWLHLAGRDDLTLGHFDRALILYPWNPRLYNNMATIVGKEGYWELSRALCLKGLEAVGPNATLYHNLGNTCMKGGLYGEAYHAFVAALRLKPDWPEAKSQAETCLDLERKGFPGVLPGHRREEYQGLAEQYRRHRFELLAQLAEPLGQP